MFLGAEPAASGDGGDGIDAAPAEAPHSWARLAVPAEPESWSKSEERTGGGFGCLPGSGGFVFRPVRLAGKRRGSTAGTVPEGSSAVQACVQNG